MPKSYLDIAAELESIGYNNDLTVSAVLRTTDLVKVVQSEDDEAAIIELITEAAVSAIENLTVMRSTEGRKLVADIADKINAIEKELEFIEQRAPSVVEEYREQLRQRIAEALSGVEVDEAKLLNEVAFFVDKFNIDEEITSF